MTVAELIEVLSRANPNAKVYTFDEMGDDELEEELIVFEKNEYGFEFCTLGQPLPLRDPEPKRID